MLLLALVPATACGDATSNSDAGITIDEVDIDGGYCQEWRRESGCNPEIGTGCSAGLRCGIVHPIDPAGDAEVEYDICCIPVSDRALELGTACTAEAGLPDDCATGSYCSWGECRKLCNVTSDCGRAPCETFVQRLGIGTCAPACDPFTLTCPDGLSCYQPLPLRADDEDPACMTHLELGLGEACHYPRQCAAGLTCVNAGADPFDLDLDGTCQPVCRVLMNDCAPATTCTGYKATNYGACVPD